MEILSKLLPKAVEGGFIIGFKVGGGSRGLMEISHLFFLMILFHVVRQILNKFKGKFE
jgi:hypothetical protein